MISENDKAKMLEKIATDNEIGGSNTCPTCGRPILGGKQKPDGGDLGVGGKYPFLDESEPRWLKRYKEYQTNKHMDYAPWIENKFMDYIPRTYKRREYTPWINKFRGQNVSPLQGGVPATMLA